MKRAAAFATAGLGAIASSAPSAPPQEVSRADITSCFEEQRAAANFSGVVYLKKAGRTWLLTNGWADPAERRPPTAETPFRLASVTKTLTRAAVGRLADSGRIDFDDPIGRFIPDLPSKFAAITVQQLLDHRSGITSLTKPGDSDRDRISQAQSLASLRPLIIDRPLEFSPGSENRYSNGGFLMLGLLVEAVTGKPFERALHDLVYSPVGMPHSEVRPSDHAAVALTANRTGVEPWPVARPNELGLPFGGTLSSASDLARFAATLQGSTFLSERAKRRVFDAKGDQYGQFGGTEGSSTSFFVFPKDQLTIIVLSNYDPPAAELMGGTLFGRVLGGPCKPMSREQWDARRRRTD